MNDSDSEFFESIRLEYEKDKRGDWLIIAASSCLMNGCDAPEWLKEAWRESLTRWHMWEARTLGEAFGVEDRPKDPRSFRKAHRTADHASAIYIRVTQLHEGQKRPIDQQLFEDIAQEFGLGITATKEIYYAMKRHLRM